MDTWQREAHPRPGELRTNEADVAWIETQRGGRRMRQKRLAASVPDPAARQPGGLGCTLYEIAPRSLGWPFHFHAANHEAVYVLSGCGRMRLGSGEIDVRAGDYIALPPGPAAAHAMENPNDAPLRYLCFSTQHAADVTAYPDSGKVAVFGGAAPGGERSQRYLSGCFRTADAVDYWTGEDVPEDGNANAQAATP